MKVKFPNTIAMNYYCHHMENPNGPEQNLRELFEHHASHEIGSGEAAPFIDIYVYDEIELQFSYGILNLAATENPDDARAFLKEQEQLECEEELDDWFLPDDWTAQEAFYLCVETLSRLGYEIDEVTYAVEQNCPSGGMVAWDEVGEEYSPREKTDKVSNPRNQLKAVYEYLKEKERKANGVPSPFPLVNFYVGDERLDYVFGPGVHSLEEHSDKERSKFDEFVNEHPDLEATAAEKSSISVTHYGWTPESALNVTKRILDQVYGISFTEITYGEIVTSGPEDDIPWTDV